MWLSLAASTVVLYTVSTTCAAVNLVFRVDVNAVMLNQNLISALTGRYSGLCSGRINVVVRAALTVLTSFFLFFCEKLHYVCNCSGHSVSTCSVQYFLRAAAKSTLPRYFILSTAPSS